MGSTETVSDSEAERNRGAADRARSLARPVAPELARQAESGNLAAASGVISLLRAGRTFLKGNRKRGALQALGGLFWVGVAVAQRRSGESRDRGRSGRGRSGRGRSGRGRSGGSGHSHSGDELSEVVDTAPDVDEAVEPGGRETDRATGEEVVDTTDADIDETDTAPEEDLSSEVEREVGDGETDQRDVVETTEVENVAETGESGKSGESGESGAFSEGESDDTESGATDRDGESQTGSESAE